MPAITLCTNKCSIFLSRLLISRRCLACWDGEGLQEKEEQNNHSWKKVTSSFSQERYLSWKPAEAHSGQTGFSKDWPVGADLTKTGICSRGQDSPSICKALRGSPSWVHGCLRTVCFHPPSFSVFLDPDILALRGILESGGLRSALSVVGLEVQCEGYCIYSAVCSC